MISLDTKPNREENLEKLDQDFETPFSPPQDIKELVTADFPALDTGVDSDEWYNSGATIAGSADVDDYRPIINYSKPAAVKTKKYIKKVS